jgi:hypothetical protein
MNGQSAVNQRCFAGVVAIVSACATISPGGPGRGYLCGQGGGVGVQRHGSAEGCASTCCAVVRSCGSCSRTRGAPLPTDAGLVITRRSGREKLHFLNPVPIRLIHDRWIDKYTEGRASALADLKTQLEEED